MTTVTNCSFLSNQHVQDPCILAQAVGRLCNPGYTVSLNGFQEGSYIPNATSTNGCTCSWSVYNLLSGCSYCVGQDQYPSWGTWVTNCGSNASSTSYLPSELRFSEGIPYWAAQNPYDWENTIFNVTQAGSIAAADYPDVTGGPLQTSTSTSTSAATTGSSTSHVSVGAIVGGVIGAIVILLIGGLITFWAMRRNRRTPSSVPFSTASQLATASAPSIRNPTTVRPSGLGYTYASCGHTTTRVVSPVHSTTSLALTAPLSSPVSSGFSSNGRNMASTITDAADMITPFLSMSPTRPANRSNSSLASRTGKTAEALPERAATPQSQRARLNPPPYSASAPAPVSPAPAATGGRRSLSMKKHKKRTGSESGMTIYSGQSHSRTSTVESATTIHTGPRTEQSLPRATTTHAGAVGSVESAVSASSADGENRGGNVETTRGRNTKQRPPAV